MKIGALIFDKDGTLFDFHATWGEWTHRILLDFAKEDPRIYRDAAAAFHFETALKRIKPSSPIIAGTVQDVAACLDGIRPEIDRAGLARWLERSSETVPQVAVTPLRPLLMALRGRGFSLSVMTNDSEGPAKAHLTAAGIMDLFDLVIGADSGFGAKPDPEPLLEIARQLGRPAAACAMIGDSLHDLHAARAAKMTAIGVLSGLAASEDLAGAADVILPDISHLPSWLDEAAQASRP